METTSNQTSRRPSVIQSFRNAWRQLFKPGDITILIATTLLLLMPALALSEITVNADMSAIIIILLLGIAISFLLARSQYGEFLSLLMSVLFSLCFVLIIVGYTLSNNLSAGIQEVVVRTTDWVQDAITGGINQDSTVFTILIALLLWFMAYNAIWHIFRIDRLWRAIIPSGMILLVFVILGEKPILDVYLMIYVFTALLLFVHSNLDHREHDWFVNRVRVPKQLRRHFIRVGAVLAMIALLIALVIPTNEFEQGADNFQEFLASNPLRRLGELWNRLFEPLDTEGPPTSDYYGGDQLNLGGAINLGDQIVLNVATSDNSQRYYWKSRTFERYEAGRWSPSASLRVPQLSPPMVVTHDEETLGSARQAIQQQFQVQSTSTRIIYTAPQPAEIGISGKIDLIYTEETADPPMNVSVIRPDKVMQPGTTYSATSFISTATADQLRSAGTDYPDWVVSPNLNLAVSVSPRVGELARQIVTEANATNPYDQAKSIERWLRRNITYNEAIPQPPPGIDPVDWVLFEEQEGYCTYYASAMVMMLRSLGIPARMAAGFTEGEFDPASGQYVVRERDAHTWVEAYFPGYGWIEFEPTSAQAPLNREGDEDLPSGEPDQEQPVLPQETPTPTLTPTQVPSPTPNPQDDSSQPLEQQPTVTASPSPTPTATPVIVPTVQPPVPPPTQSADFFQAIFPTLGFFLLCTVMLFLIAGLLVLIYWWWEWRGMKGLSPVSRSYGRLLRYISLLGVTVKTEETPEEKRKRIVDRVPVAEHPVNVITQLYTDERYGPEPDERRQKTSERSAARAWLHARRNIVQRWIRKFIPFVK